MSKFKVGDKVRIKSNLVTYEDYGPANFVTGMKSYMGQTHAIESLTSRGNFSLNGIPFAWSESMLELVEEAEKNPVFYMVFVEGKNGPTYKHDTYESAKKEATRLAEAFNTKSYILEATESIEVEVTKITVAKRTVPVENVYSELPF